MGPHIPAKGIGPGSDPDRRALPPLGAVRDRRPQRLLPHPRGRAGEHARLRGPDRLQGRHLARARARGARADLRRAASRAARSRSPTRPARRTRTRSTVACEPAHPQGFGYTRGWSDGGQPGVYRGEYVTEHERFDVTRPERGARARPQRRAASAAPSSRARSKAAAWPTSSTCAMTAYEGEWVASAILEDRAAKLGDRTFITASERQPDLRRARARGGAASPARSRQRGVQPGDRVATMLPSGLEYLKVWWGIVWAGAVDVPVNNDFKGEFLDHVVGGSGAKALRDRPPLARAGAALRGHPDRPAGAPGRPGRRGHHAHERDLLYIMYTSGTTGRAKGVMHANRSALWNAAAWLEILGLTHEDTAYSMFPLFHVTARSAVVTARCGPAARRTSPTASAPPASGTRSKRRTPPGSATWASSSTSCTRSRRRPEDRDNAVRIAFGAAAPPGDHDALRGTLRPAARRGLRLHRARPGQRAEVPAPAQARHDGPALPAPARRGPRRRRQPAAAQHPAARSSPDPPSRSRWPRATGTSRARRSTPSATCGSTPATAATSTTRATSSSPTASRTASDDAARTSRASRSSAASSATPTCSSARPTPSRPS